MKKQFLIFIALILVSAGNLFADEKILYNTTFQDWLAVSASASESSITKTTDFSSESLTFKILQVAVVPTGTQSKFTTVTENTGYLQTAKVSGAYIRTSPLNSITKVVFTQAATGSNRAFRVWKKNATDADWVSIYSTGMVSATGEIITVNVNDTNVALQFTAQDVAQNSYMCDLKIYGNYTITKPQQTLTTSINIVGAGTITTAPTGGVYDQGTSVSLTAIPNFGYHFVKWVDGSNTDLSTTNPYSVTMDADKTVQAIFQSVNTYSLTLNTSGGAPSYMISASPAGTIVNGQTMYETGTNITLTAANNQIFTFTNWLTGETSSTLSLTMNQNQNVTAAYSAIDYIVAWDFYKTGSSGRPADFYSTSDNQTSTLIIRNAAGTSSSWLDKSIVAAAGYGSPLRGSAVNWKNLTDQYYYQTSFSAKDFTNIKVSAGMLYNYNAYTVQNFEYSLDGSTFTPFGVDSLKSANNWYDKTFSLPAECDHADIVYIRWIPNYTSTVAGTTSTNDGTALSSIYVTATAAIYNDGVAPVLSSSVPAASSTGASSTGKVVLTFDEKVQIVSGTTASLGSKTLSPAVSGKTITFSYTGLDYNTAYSFSLPANTVSDLAGNTLTSPINITFTTMARPTVTKKLFDFVVGVDGDFKAALQAAQTASSSGNRFYIFFPNGQYNIGANTGDSNQMTTITTPKLSLIGQSNDNVVIYNKSTQESINSTATMYFTSASSNNYMQDISLMNKMDYRLLPLVGRGVALWDQGNKNIYKNVKLLSNQDTYYTGNAIRSYLENCEIHGTVDYICGGGDIFFNECLLYMEERSGNVVCAPATSTTWGYVFSNCTIDGFASDNGSFYLGRPWQNSPKAVYINTKMNILPASAGWTTMGAAVWSTFGEYNSTSSTGTPVDVSSRMTTYTYNGVSTPVNPVVTADQAAQYTIDNVVGGIDTWQPRLYTDQATIPVISGNGTNITWTDNSYVLCWAVFKDDAFVTFVTTNSYTIPGTITSGIYTVRAANEMGGLSAVSNTYTYDSTATSISINVNNKSNIVSQSIFTVDGKKIRSLEGFKGVVIVRTVYADGHVETTKVMKSTND